MKLTNQEVLNLYEILSGLDVPGNGRFTYTIAKNRAFLKPFADTLREASATLMKGDERAAAYRASTEELIKKYAVNDDGTPCVQPSPDGRNFARTVPQAKHQEFMQARMALDDQYADVNRTFMLRQDEFASILKEEVDVPLRLIDIKDLPDGALKTSTMNNIFLFVRDPGEEDEGKKDEGLKRVK